MHEIELDKWYNDVPREHFIAIMKQYPMVPFFVDGESLMMSGAVYRWNPETEKVEEEGMNDEWWPGDLSTTVDDGWNVEFVVFKTTFYKCIKEDLIDNLPMIYSVILRSDYADDDTNAFIPLDILEKTLLRMFDHDLANLKFDRKDINSVSEPEFINRLDVLTELLLNLIDNLKVGNLLSSGNFTRLNKLRAQFEKNAVAQRGGVVPYIPPELENGSVALSQYLVVKKEDHFEIHKVITKSELAQYPEQVILSITEDGLYVLPKITECRTLAEAEKAIHSYWEANKRLDAMSKES